MPIAGFTKKRNPTTTRNRSTNSRLRPRTCWTSSLVVCILSRTSLCVNSFPTQPMPSRNSASCKLPRMPFPTLTAHQRFVLKSTTRPTPSLFRYVCRDQNKEEQTQTAGTIALQSYQSPFQSASYQPKPVSHPSSFLLKDFGLGMSKDDLVTYLGTIAKSGSKAFVTDIKKGGSSDAASTGSADNIIGQFGVGFYSSFMVGSNVTVCSKSHEPDSKAYKWESDGVGSFTISEIPDASTVPRGVKIELALKDEYKKFASKETIQDIVKKYSNFINAPILINGMCQKGDRWMVVNFELTAYKV